MKRIVILLFALAVGACNSDKVTESPPTLMGGYVLQSVNGVSLPAQAGLQDGSVEIIADTIYIGENDFAYQKMIVKTSTTAAPTVVLRTLNFAPKSFGKFEAEYPCPDLAANATSTCLGAPHYKGSLTSTGLTINYSAIYRTPMVYKRIITYLQERTIN